MRLGCLVAAGVLIAAIFAFQPPIPAVVALVILSLYQLILAAPNTALRIERTDGQAWTVRFCRDYRFDVSLAFEDAERRRDAMEQPGGRTPSAEERAAA